MNPEQQSNHSDRMRDITIKIVYLRKRQQYRVFVRNVSADEAVVSAVDFLLVSIDMTGK
jgi:hypothetical protein